MRRSDPRSRTTDVLPDDLLERVNELDDRALRELLHVVQDALRRHTTRLDIEPRAGEEIVRVAEREGYTEVVKREPCADGCAECPHGPYLYHVVREPDLDGRESGLHWRYLGRVRS